MNLYRKKEAKTRTFLLFLCLFTLQTVAFAQKMQPVTLQKKNISVIEALKEIEKQSKMSVAYNESQLKNRKNIDLDIQNGSLQNTLSTVLRGTGFSFELKNNRILIVPAPQPEAVAQRKITGLVMDENNEPLIGANIMLEGTARGVVTDMDGRFVIDAHEGAMLRISYIGYVVQRVSVTDKSNYRIQLKPDAELLSEVVVTALGIKREQKALSYNVQQVKADQITQIKDANFINSLNGKVAGVNINTSSSGVGGASKVIMRGAKSIQQSSNALYVIDGIPMYNFGGGGGTEFDSRGATEGIADLNPDDIESISVLTGAAAAALYGSNAANGAIVVTTKKGKAGRLQVSLSSNTEWMNPFVLPRFQNRYGTGSHGTAGGSTIQSWGPLLNEAARTGYKPRDFFDTGMAYTNSITLSTGTEKNQTFLSAGAVNSEGIIPNNKYNRYNFTFRNTTSFLSEKMKLDVGANYIVQDDRNMTNQGIYSNPVVPAYLFPRGDDFETIKVFERWDPARKIKTQFWPQGESDLRMQNPYWIAYRNMRENDKKRYMLSAQLSYDVLDWLNIAGRVRVDNSNGQFEQKLYASSNTTICEGSSQGHYSVTKMEDAQTYADVLANINKRYNDFSLVANIGASIIDTRCDELTYRGPIRENGIPNVFNVFDLDNAKKKARQAGWSEQTQSIFASTEVGWRSMLYLTLTGRNDWASQLANSPQSSFFYPSVGLSAVVSEMTRMPDWVNLLKTRGSFSSVGMPYMRHLTTPTYEYDEVIQAWKPKTHFPIGKLYPERTNSWELGLDARLFNNFSLAFSWYRANTFNQTFNPKVSISSGYSKIYLQTGDVRNTGVELTLGYGHAWGDFAWDTGFTFSHNKNEIMELVDNYEFPETGQVISKDRLEIKGLGKAKFILKKGGTLGDLYTQSGLKRDDNGLIEVDPSGALATVDNLPDIKLGSVFPKANLAWRNDFAYKGITMGMLFTARVGGVVYSATQAAMDHYGVSENSANDRDAGTVHVENSIHVNPQVWYTAIGSQSGIPQYYTYSATNVRLQEAHIGYALPSRWFNNMMNVNVSIVGRNLLMIYNRAPFDPENVATTANYYQGIDYFMVPGTRNVGCNVKVTF